MTRLPQPGSDAGVWGNVLNDFLSQSHNADGSLKSASLTAAGAEATTNKGQANGYAGLDTNGLVPLSQLPAASVSGIQSVNGQTGAIVTLHASDVGLGNVNNTSDATKPISTATQSALDAKYTFPSGGIPESDLASAVQTKLDAAAPVTSVAGRTGAVVLSKSDVGLSSVDNTADVNKPLSTAAKTYVDNAVAGLQANSVLYSTNPDVRPTANSAIVVLFICSTQPTAMIGNDVWLSSLGA